MSAKILPFRPREEEPEEPQGESKYVWVDATLGFQELPDLTERFATLDACVWNIRLGCWQVD